MASMGNQNSGNHQASQDSKQIPYISVQDVAAKLDSKETNFIVVDVRDADFAAGHIIGAKNVPSSVFQDRVDELAKELHDSGKQVVFHCMLSQVRGPTCAQHFAEHLAREYPQHTCSIRVMRGGYRHFLSTFAQDSVKVRQYFEDLNLDNY